MICPHCLFDEDKPLGTCVKVLEGRKMEMLLNDNGMRYAFFHSKLCLKGVDTSITVNKDSGHMNFTMRTRGGIKCQS